MSNVEYATMVLLTYTPGSDVEAHGYDDWLRETDNPFFNTIPGIAHYSNWKVLDGADVPFSHFDLLGLDGPDAVEQVWFNKDLDTFRDGWVAKWGYGGDAPQSPVNGYGLLVRLDQPTSPDFGQYATLAFDRTLPSGAVWTAEAALHKHWALGPAPDGKWRLPLAATGLGHAFGLRFAEARPDLPGGRAPRLVGECIAAPEMPWR
jgi:hypothetical protein